MDGAQALIKTLDDLGIEYVFGYSGGAALPIFDALETVKTNMKFVLVRHEQGAVHMADGYARATGKPACVLACPSNARLFGDVHDPDSIVSRAIRERGGYTLMPEWDTRPANHYLPRRRTEIKIHSEDLVRVANPLKIDGRQPETPPQGAGREDFAT